MSSLINIGLSIAFIAFMVLIGPWCFIWAVNTLIAAGGNTTFFVPFTFWTWLAALIIGGLRILPTSRRD